MFINNKFFIYLGLFLVSFVSNAQTAIGKKTVENVNVILDFKNEDNRGVILPWVLNQNVVSTPVGGTLIFDSNDKKIKYYRSGSNPSWEDLSINSGNVDLTIQSGLQEIGKTTVIGAKTSVAEGVLVLEANDKAMILPKVTSPHLNINQPAAGTMVFDPESKMLCLFNGTEWSFWKAE